MHLMDDATLVAAARSGDDTAWAAIYDRYADKLHDHCHRILHDRDEAADALHDAFLAASRNLHQLREPDRLRPWLYSICRHTSLRRLKARGRVDLTDSVDEMMAPETDLGRGVRAEELSELVWAAAAGLNGRDQALLDLNLRQGLEGQDLADAMGTSLNNSYVMLSRMRDQVERSLGALLIARIGREDCEELSALLARLGRHLLPHPAQAGGPARRRLRDLLGAPEVGGQPAGPAGDGSAGARPGAAQDPGHLEHPQHRGDRPAPRALHQGRLRRPRRRCRGLPSKGGLARHRRRAGADPARRCVLRHSGEQHELGAGGRREHHDPRRRTHPRHRRQHLHLDPWHRRRRRGPRRRPARRRRPATLRGRPRTGPRPAPPPPRPAPGRRRRRS